MQTEFELNLPLKGQRNYVHSTDIWNALAQKLQADDTQDTNLKINLRTVTGANIHVSSVDDGITSTNIGDARLVDSNTHFLLKASNNRLHRKIEDFSEAIQSSVMIDGHSIQVSLEGPGSAIERIVEANKILLTSLYKGVDKWLAASLSAPISFVDVCTGHLVIEHTAAIKNRTFFSKIFDSRGLEKGQVTFVGVDKATFSTMEKNL